jgi:glycosyltransferase involved in cell wall biosynthesis
MIDAPTPSAQRVTMFVANDMRFDSRVRREASALAASGRQVHVVARASAMASALPVETIDGYTIVRTPATGGAAVDPPARRRTTRKLPRAIIASAYVATRPLLGATIPFIVGWQMHRRAWSRRVLATVEPSDIWHAHDLNTLQLAIECVRRFGGRLIYDSHEIFSEAGATARLSPLARRVLRRLERRWAARCDRVITVNESIAEFLSLSLGIPQVDVVHNCADLPASGPSPLRARIGAGSSEEIILYHGSLAAGRGVADLVRALCDVRLQRAHLVIMGSGPIRTQLEALAESLSVADRLHLIPQVAPSEVTTWVAGADVVAVPIEPTTLNHRLSSPNKMFEAIAAGVPVIGPDFIEFRRILRDPARGPLGVLYEQHTPQAIASAIVSVIAVPARERETLRERCRRAARERWSWEREAPRLLAIYDSFAFSPATTSERPALA